jgi:hypothetical protein
MDDNWKYVEGSMEREGSEASLHVIMLQVISTGGIPAMDSPMNIVRKPKDYLILSILNTIFCCCPLGVLAITFSAQVSTEQSCFCLYVYSQLIPQMLGQETRNS